MIKRLLSSLFESLIRNISGGLGNSLRVFYYSRRFKDCGSEMRIGVGVVFRGPESMSFGNRVWIDDYCLLIAGDTGPMSGREVIRVRNNKFNGSEGELVVGSSIHIAPYAIVHAYGGIIIKDFVGIASGAQIYSMSNHYQSKEKPNELVYKNPMVSNDKRVVFIKSPIVLERNSFVGINSVVLSGNIGENSIISPLSVVKYNIPPNSIAEGNPARPRHRLNSVFET